METKMNQKATFIGLAKHSDICREIKIVELNENYLVYKPENKRSMFRYDLTKFSDYVLIDAWGHKIDKERQFKTKSEGFSIMSRSLFCEKEAEKAFKDCLNQVEEKALKGNIINEKRAICNL